MQTRAEETGEGPTPAHPEPSRSATGDLPRYQGPRAEIAHYSGVLLDAQAADERDREREACVKLAHLYTQRGTNLDAAVALARRALAIQDDPALRTEVAGWLAGLGDPAGAALELRGTAASIENGRARPLLQAGVLLARARRADAAALVLEEAAEIDPADPAPQQIVATLSAWAGDVIPREQGARAYIAAAERQLAAGDERAALEDLLRAFELCSTSPDAARAVATALRAQGRPLAADEILRAHAVALVDHGTPDAATLVHAERLTNALEQQDVTVALSAALDLDLSQPPRTELGPRIDEALTLAGLPELAAARVERTAMALVGPGRATALEGHARQLESASPDDERAVFAWIAAATADPAQSAALDALRALAARGDPDPLVEALVRVCASDPAELPAPRSVLSRLALELATIAEGAADDPRLADWALDRARVFDAAQIDATAHAQARMEPLLAKRETEIGDAERALEGKEAGTRDARIDALRSLVRLLGRSPASEEQAVASLAALCRAEHKDAASGRALRMLYERDPAQPTRSELYESVIRARLEAPLGRREHVQARVELARLVEADGSGRRGVDELIPLLELSDMGPFGASHVLLAALAARDARLEARAYAALAKGVERHTSALLLAASADAYRRAGTVVEARKEAERAVDLDPACARAASVLAEVATAGGGRDAAAAIERALGLIVPRAWACDALARSLEEIGEHDLAFAWTHRWLALAPGDRRAMSELLRRCQLGTDAPRIAEALNWVLAQPDPADERAGLLLDALTLLFTLDKVISSQVARRILDVLGPSAVVRERLGDLADEHEDAGLAIAVLERSVASNPIAPREILLELVHRRTAAADYDGAAQELLRATTASVDPASVLDGADEVEEAAGTATEGEAPPGFGSDGLVAIAEVRARCLSAMLAAEVGSPHEAAPRRAITRGAVADAWRLVGAMRWDLAHDPRGAELALFSGAEAGGDQSSFELYARDLAELAGPDRAVAALFERLASLEDAPPAELVALAMAAGQLAAEHGLASYALDGALAALAIEPSNADAISLAESQAPHVERGDVAIDHIYEALARSALGMYGRRAAHYRAARQLERLGARELALKHALKAFEAVPTEGTSWSVLTRLIDPVRGSAAAVELFQRVAASAKGGDQAGWFRRAIELSGTDREGLERRLDVILRALGIAAEASLAEALSGVVEGLAEGDGLPEGAAMRIASVTHGVLVTLEGPDGARVAARLSRVAVEAGCSMEEGEERSRLEDAAFKAIDKAVEIDGEVEVFEVILPSAPKYAAFAERAVEFVGGVLERTTVKHALVGPPLLRFASAIADALPDADLSAELLAEALRKEAPATPSAAPPPRNQDPFADPSLLESGPPPKKRHTLSLELSDSEPPPSFDPASATGVESLLDLASELQSEVPPPGQPRTVSRPRRPSSGNLPAVRFAPDLAPIRDGFAALFESNAPPPMPAPEPIPRVPPLPLPPRQDDDLEAKEAEARARGDHEAVSELLRLRIEKAVTSDQVRVLKLRRAAVLEQGLARVDEARRELLDVLEQDPNDRSALSFLADLFEKRGEHGQAAPLFEKLSSLGASADEERRRYALAAAKSHVNLGDSGAAIRILDALPGSAVTVEVAQTRVDILRKSGDVFSLVLAIDQLIAVGNLSDEQVAKVLVEGSRASAASGDQQGALIRARRAARLAPTLPDAVLECVALEYKSRGTGTPREAQAVVETLQGLGGELEPAQVELHTFLLAESIDVIQGGGAGLRELSHRHAEVGPLPLIALGMAERLARSRSFEAAVPLFAQATTGDLRGMRNKSRVALAATDAAIHSGHLAEARAFLEEAEQSAELRAQVERRRREILAYDDNPEVARPVVEELLKDATGTNRARLLHRLARLSVDSNFERAIELYEEALVAARRDRGMAEKIRTEILEILEARGLGKLETIPAPASDPEPASGPVSSQPADSAARPAIVPPDADGAVEIVPREAANDGPPSIEPPPDAAPAEGAGDRDSGSDVVEADPSWFEEKAPSTPPIATAPTPPSPERSASPSERPRQRVEPLGPLAPPARPLFLNAREENMFEQLLDGYIDSGDALVDGYAANERARAQDVLVVRRHQVALMPGEPRLLVALREAALAERDEVYARALDHVLGLEGGEAVKPPPLHAQPREPELLSALLFRDISSRETEVLAIAWEAGMYRRELASYGVTGSDRVALTAKNVLGETYTEIAAVLGSPRPFFHKRGDEPGQLAVALMAQPAIVATGEFRGKTPELIHRLASVHASASPELVLAACLDDGALLRLFEAMIVAFGPVRPRDEESPPSSASGAAFRADVARLASELWQRINPRAERRLRDLCELGPLDASIARATARKATRRAGLFASGDLGLALRLLSQELGQPDLSPSASGSLEAACEASAEASDLVRLATRMEYAEARWQLGSPASMRR